MTEDVTSERHLALASSMRRGILRLIAGSAQPVDAARVAEACGVHVTTARFHLDQLEAAGLLRRETLQPSGRGRPRIAFRLLHPPQEEPARELTAVLADALSLDTDGGRARATRAGERWSERYPSAAGATEDGVGAVTRVFGELGFAPDVHGEGRDRVIELHACPFRDAAVEHPAVVCAAHSGLLSGILTRLGASPQDATLEPFVEPELCLVHLGGALAAG